MFTGFTQKVTGYMMKKMGEAKSKEMNVFIEDLLQEIEKTLIMDDVHYLLVEKISKEAKEYLNNNKNQILNGDKQLIQNLLHCVLQQNMIEDVNFHFKKNIVLLGDNGAGKTTFACKLALYLKEKFEEEIEVINIDPYRFASKEQIEENLEGEGIIIKKLENINKESLKESIHSNDFRKIFDTAGFSNSTPEYMELISNIFPHNDTTYIYVGNSLVGQNSFTVIEKIKSFFNIDGIVITNCDGEANCGLFLSSSFLLQKPIVFISENELIKSDDYNQSLLVFQREKILKRLVGLYDEAGLQEAIDKVGKKNQGLMDRIMHGVFDYQTLKEILEGTLTNKFNGLLGSMGNMKNVDSEKKKEMAKMLTIINSMSKEERTNRALLKNNASALHRFERIARGCNFSVEDVQRNIMMMDTMIGTLKNFSEKGLTDMEKTGNLDNLKEKLSDPSFMSQYIDREDTNMDNIAESQDKVRNITMDNHSNNPMLNNPEALRALKNFSAKQIYDMIQNIPTSMLASMPGMGNIDPSLVKNITVEQIELMLKNLQ